MEIQHLNLQYILDIASKFDKEGSKEQAQKWLVYAERYEAIMKKNKETMLERTTLRESYE